MTTQRLFPATNGPATVTATSGGWLLGVQFSVTGGMRWLNGIYHWVPGNGDITPRQVALWQVYASGTQFVVPGSTATSGPMTQGQWNFVPLPAPVQLAPGAQYVAAVGWTATAGIPVTANQFGGGQPFAAGIVSGFLTGWSSGTGTNGFPEPYGLGGQMVFSNTLGPDPGAAMPNNGSGNNNLWVDVQVDDTAPAGYAGSYRMYPNMRDLGNFALDTANGFTLGVEFSLSADCAADAAWFYSPATVGVLPSAAGFYRVSDQALVAVSNSPSWSGAAGSGWISAPFAGVTLKTGVNYKYVVFQGANSIWNAAVAKYYSSGFGGAGLVAGPVTVPDAAGATPGQQSYHQGGSIHYPDTVAGPFSYGLDFEVTPLPPAPPAAAGGVVSGDRGAWKKLVLLGA